MIGQQNILNYTDKLLAKKFPRFTVITGPKGQGKKTLARYITDRLKYPVVISGIKIDDLREIIALSYKQTEPIIYLIPDADKMSIGAKNSLLKVIEEPPNNAYFIMTLESINNTLETIKSRCIELKLETYSMDDLNKFIDLVDYTLSNSEKAFLLDTCANKYEIETICKYGVSDFYSYVEKVVNNIYKVQSANAFKLAEKLALKNEEDKYDIKLFLQTFRNLCINKMITLLDVDDNEEFACYARSIDETTDTIKNLSINGINKQSLIDVWILNIRKIWR